MSEIVIWQCNDRQLVTLERESADWIVAAATEAHAIPIAWRNSEGDYLFVLMRRPTRDGDEPCH